MKPVISIKDPVPYVLVLEFSVGQRLFQIAEELFDNRPDPMVGDVLSSLLRIRPEELSFYYDPSRFEAIYAKLVNIRVRYKEVFCPEGVMYLARSLAMLYAGVRPIFNDIATKAYRCIDETPSLKKILLEKDVICLSFNMYPDGSLFATLVVERQGKFTHSQGTKGEYFFHVNYLTQN